jgi:ferredoxin
MRAGFQNKADTEEDMKAKRNIIEINEDLCNGCGQCVPSCAEGAIGIVDGKAKLVKDMFCDGLGACLGDCPTGALKIIEREADTFDEKAVHEHLMKIKKGPGPSPFVAVQSGCPSMTLHTFAPAAKKPAAAKEPGGASESALSHWPIQIRLIPPTAPFLKDGDLLVAADCVPAACPDFHRDFLEGRVLLLGCPKFDDKAEYLQRFTDIFRANDIRSVKVLRMEVPCCSFLLPIVTEAASRAGKDVPVEEIVITRKGEMKKA